MCKVKYQPRFRHQLRELHSPELALAVRAVATELAETPMANAQVITISIGTVYLRELGAGLRLVYRVYPEQAIVLIVRII